MLSVSPNPTTSENYTVSGAYTCTRSYIYFTLYETNPWGDVTPFRHASVPFTQAIANRLDGTYTYRLEACYLKQYQNYPEAEEICEIVGDTLSVTVDGPDPDSVGTQLGYTFQARVNSTSPATATMLFIDRTSSAAGGGVFQDIVLRKSGNAFELVEPDSVTGTSPGSWSTTTAVDLVLNDINLDGFVDVLVRGLGSAITGAVDQIVYAPGRTGGSPTILTAVDSSLKNFLSEVSSWTQNPMFFQQHQETVVATITIYRENCFIDERRRYCRSYPILVLERSGVRYTNKSTEAREFAQQFSVANGKINPDIALGGQQAKKLSGILEDVLGVEFFNANLERSCPQTQTMLVFDQFEIWCDNVTAFGRMIIDLIVGTDRKVKDAPQPGRGLNNGEIEFLEGYGPLESGTFSYDELRIVPRSREFFRDNDATHSRAYVTSTEPHIVNVRRSDYKEAYDTANIEDVKKLGAILHEVTHTCQLLCEGWKHGRHPMEKGMQYVYRVFNTPLGTDLNFEVLGPDQQAEVIHDRMRTNEGLQPARPGNELRECVEMEQPPATGCVNDVKRAVAITVMRDELNGLSIPGVATVPPESE